VKISDHKTDVKCVCSGHGDKENCWS